MNNKTLKIIAVFLALILAIPAFALFADGPDGPPDDTNQTEIETGDTSAGGAGEELTVPETEFPFEDVYDNTPIHPIILYVYSNGILKGVSDTRFAPGAKLTRAMAVTIIHRTYLLTASDSIE
ncbi:MAG: S-layer homology domain-containing protein, partial [Clostridiales bacterium]|nr:S-layer homology domain-containing protein [Clostridiales bacterium]